VIYLYPLECSECHLERERPENYIKYEGSISIAQAQAQAQALPEDKVKEA